MKKIFITCLLALAGYMAKCQTVSVFDKTTLQPVVSFVLLADNNIQPTLGNIADLGSESLGASKLIFKSPGYQDLETTLSKLALDNYKVYMPPSLINLDEIVVAASRGEEKKSQVAQQIEGISKKDIRFNNPISTGDMLSQSGLVFVQASQYGGSSPVMRGFEANRILLMIDGVRMNNAIYRGGHLQNVITIDPNIIEKTELVFGPGSSVYGSDALGGVIHIYTQKPLLAVGKNTKVNGNAMVRYSSAASEWGGNLAFNVGLKKWAYLTSISYKQMGDVMTGSVRSSDYPDFGKRFFTVQRINGLDSMVPNSNVNLQTGSGYSQIDLMEKILFKPNKWVELTANLQYSNSSDVPRYDRLSETVNGFANWAEWYYGPQLRQFASIKADLTKSNNIYDKLSIILSGQQIQEDRTQRRYRTNNRDIRMETVGVMGLNVDFHKTIKEKHELRYGIESQTNNVNSVAYRDDIVKNIRRETISPRYPGHSNKVNYTSIYVNHKWNPTKLISLNEGLRLNTVNLHSEFSDSNLAVLKMLSLPFGRTISQSNSALTGNVGLVWQVAEHTRLNLLAASGFRAPNLDDVTRFFDSKPGTFLVVPNPDLKPEQTWNYEMGVSNTVPKKFKFEAAIFNTRFNNIILLKNTPFNGTDSIIYDGKMTVTQANQNAGRASIWGFNMNVMAEFSKGFSAYSTLTYTRGNLSTNQPLDHIPPMYGKTGLRYTTKKLQVEFYSQYNGWKRIVDYRLDAEDNEVYATPAGTPSWYTLNLKASYSPKKYLSIQAGIENLMDVHYRVFASGFSAPGRNIIFALRGNF